VLVRDLHQRATDVGRVGGAGWIVGIDDDERAGAWRDQTAHVLDVRHPSLRGIGAIKNRTRADLRQNRRVQWIGRYRDQHLVARFCQRGERQLDTLRRSRRNDHPVRRDRHTALGAVRGDRFTSRKDTDRRGIAVVPASDRSVDRFDEVRRRLEAKDDRIADIEITHSASGGLNLSRLRHDIADCVDEPPNS
jgi:hypothetical protein